MVRKFVLNLPQQRYKPMENYGRLEGENENSYIIRICQHKDEIGTWDDVTDILNRELGYNYTSSKYRKPFQSYCTNVEENGTDSYITELRAHKEALQKERVKLQTEKLEYNKKLRVEARDEMIKEAIIEAINNLSPLRDSYVEYVPTYKNEKEYLLAFGDIHYGAEFEIRGVNGETINAYSPEIAEERLNLLFSRTVDVIEKEHIGTLNIVNLSDNIDGILRMSQLMKLRYGVVDSTIMISELLAKFLDKLSDYAQINYYMCLDSNHDQLRLLDGKKGTFEQDNMDKVILWYLSTRLESNPNVNIIKQQSQNLGLINMCGYNVGYIHGEVKNMENALKGYSAIYNTPINYLIGAHYHHAKQEDIGFDSEVLNIPSVIGVDRYSMSLNKCSNAGAKLYCFERDRGKTIEYTIKLSDLSRSM